MDKIKDADVDTKKLMKAIPHFETKEEVEMTLNTLRNSCYKSVKGYFDIISFWYELLMY